MSTHDDAGQSASSSGDPIMEHSRNDERPQVAEMPALQPNIMKQSNTDSGIFDEPIEGTPEATANAPRMAVASAATSNTIVTIVPIADSIDLLPKIIPSTSQEPDGGDCMTGAPPTKRMKNDHPDSHVDNQIPAIRTLNGEIVENGEAATSGVKCELESDSDDDDKNVFHGFDTFEQPSLEADDEFEYFATADESMFVKVEPDFDSNDSYLVGHPEDHSEILVPQFDTGMVELSTMDISNAMDVLSPSLSEDATQERDQGEDEPTVQDNDETSHLEQFEPSSDETISEHYFQTQNVPQYNPQGNDAPAAPSQRYYGRAQHNGVHNVIQNNVQIVQNNWPILAPINYPHVVQANTNVQLLVPVERPPYATHRFFGMENAGPYSGTNPQFGHWQYVRHYQPCWPRYQFQHAAPNVYFDNNRQNMAANRNGQTDNPSTYWWTFENRRKMLLRLQSTQFPNPTEGPTPHGYQFLTHGTRVYRRPLMTPGVYPTNYRKPY